MVFSSGLRGLELVPARWHCLVPEERPDGTQSRPPVPLGDATRRVPLSPKGDLRQGMRGRPQAVRWAAEDSGYKI